MNTNRILPVMNQMIFKMDLAVETVSLYLLCCGLVDSGDALSVKNLKDIWNGTEDAFNEALGDLENRKIVRKVMSDQKGTTVYRLSDSESWQTP